MKPKFKVGEVVTSVYDNDTLTVTAFLGNDHGLGPNQYLCRIGKNEWTYSEDELEKLEEDVMNHTFKVGDVVCFGLDTTSTFTVAEVGDQITLLDWYGLYHKVHWWSLNHVGEVEDFNASEVKEYHEKTYGNHVEEWNEIL